MSELETVDRDVLMGQLVGQDVALPDPPIPPAKLDHIAGLVDLYDKAVREYNDLGAEIEQLKTTIQAAMGDAQAATVKGVSTFTFNLKDSWRTTDLKKDHGHLTRNYMVQQVVDKFDVKAFAKDHPSIARQYQTREFRRVSGTRNAVGR
jgi:hypothetical protein